MSNVLNFGIFGPWNGKVIAFNVRLYKSHSVDIQKHRSSKDLAESIDSPTRALIIPFMSKEE
jgi:hypothetical protein